MEPYEIFILVTSGLLLLLIAALLIRTRIIGVRKAKIGEVLQSFFADEAIVWHHDAEAYQIEVNTPERVLLFKVVPFYFRYELIITNPTFWCVNQDPKNWKRSSKPVLVPGTESFINLKLESDKKISKVALIYPTAYNISHYLNESDVELVRFDKSVHGVHFVKFDDLADFLRSRK